MPEAGVSVDADVEVRPGLHACEAVVKVDRPRLWWPVGHGEQALYELRASLEIDGKEIGCRQASVGFRRVQFDQAPHPDRGRYFNLEVNGRKIFVKGSNFVPADMIFARIDRARYETLTNLALESNFNFLRVWGGGLYEADAFYEMCDAKGLLVWQEFIFACSRYPTTDQAFYEDVQREATWNVRRLASHPSLIAWCGNNEIEWGDWDWDYGRTGVIMPDHAFFHITLPRLVAREDPTRYYQPSSPFSPDRMPPNSDHAGDQHPWSIGFFANDFRKYREMTCRFASEGGILGPTSLLTMRACLPEPAQQTVLSFAWQVHDNSVATWTEPSAPDEMIRQWVGKEPRELSIEQFAYWAGLVQGEGLREYVENFRRRMFDSGAAIFWMFNDCWPATRSWTTVDYHLRRTPAFHAVRRAMAPIHLVVAQDAEEIVVFGINDTTAPVAGELAYGVMNLTGGRPYERRERVTLPPDASTRLASFPATAWPRPNESAAFAVLSGTDGRAIARNRLFLPMFREMTWPAPDVDVVVKDGRAAFRSRTFALGVCLDLDGTRTLSDNFFDVFPGEPHVIPWPDPHPPRILFTGNLAVG